MYTLLLIPAELVGGEQVFAVHLVGGMGFSKHTADIPSSRLTHHDRVRLSMIPMPREGLHDISKIRHALGSDSDQNVRARNRLFKLIQSPAMISQAPIHTFCSSQNGSMFLCL